MNNTIIAWLATKIHEFIVSLSAFASGGGTKKHGLLSAKAKKQKYLRASFKMVGKIIKIYGRGRPEVLFFSSRYPG